MSREIIRLRTLVIVGAIALVAVSQASNPDRRDPPTRDTAAKSISDQAVDTPLGSAEVRIDGQASAPEADGALPEAILAPPIRAYFNNFDDAAFLTVGVTGGVTMAGAVEPVQGYAGLGQAGNQFAGRFWRNTSTGNPAQATRLILSGLPPHRSINLRFLLSVIDSWDGNTGGASPDYFNVAVNGTVIFSRAFDNGTLSDQGYVPLPGGQLTWATQRGFNTGFNDAAYDMGLGPVFVGIPHSASILAIDFLASGGGWQGGSDESWAIENLEVLISDMGPDPAPPFIDAVSREVSVLQLSPSFEFTDAVSREVSVLIYDGPNPLFTDAISREVSVFSPYSTLELTDAVSREVSLFSVINIVLGTPYDGVLAPGNWLFFSVTTPADLTLRIELDHVSTTAWTELYASFGHVPDTYDAEFSSESPGQPDQEIIIPNTEAGTYFVLARVTTDSNPSASRAFRLTADALPFGLFSATPDSVGASEEVSIAIVGARLGSLADVYLRSSASGTQIRPVHQSVIDEAHRVLRFHLSAATIGDYDIVVQSPQGQVASLDRSVKVQAETKAELQVSLVPSPFIRSGHGRNTGRTHITLTNPSNADVPITVLTVFAKNGPDIDLTIEGVEEISLKGDSEWVSTQVLFESISAGQQLDIPVRIVVGPGFPGPNVQIYSYAETYTRQTFRDGILLDDDGPIDRLARTFALEAPSATPEVVEIFVASIKEAAGSYFDQFGFNLGNGSFRSAASLVDVIAEFCVFDCRLFGVLCAAACVPGTLGLGAAVCIAACLTVEDKCVDCCRDPCGSVVCPSHVVGLCAPPPPVAGCDPPCAGDPNCPAQCVEKITYGPGPSGVGLVQIKTYACQSGACTPGGRSTDPNEKWGPLGHGAVRFLPGKGPLVYRVLFENLPAATAPAAEVHVTDVIDPALNLATLQFRSVQIGPMTVEVPAGRASLEMAVDMQDVLGLLAGIRCGVNSATRILTCSLTALDPQTLQLPSDPLLGLLPPNDNSGRGEGYFEFSIEPNAITLTGTVVKNKASIVFDYNDPIVTNEVLNTIDVGPPQSAVGELPAKVTHGKFEVCWSGEDDDDGSGITNFQILAAEQGGSYLPWLTKGIEACSAFSTRGVGHTFHFYSIASDNVGNVEVAPTVPLSSETVPDATTTVRFGDFNGDGVANGFDYYHPIELNMRACMRAPTVSARCGSSDYDSDGTVDLFDFSVLQNGFTNLPDLAVFSTCLMRRCSLNDRDSSGLVDLFDFALLQNAFTDLSTYIEFAACFTAPGTVSMAGCEPTDFNLNGNVDLYDFAAFQLGFGGPQ